VLKRTPISVLTVVLLMLSLLRVAIAGKATDYPRRPKLVLILVIDQFRYDYLVRFRPQFVEGGFNLLLKGGANFADCRYDYATTATGPGHATLSTGAYANVHGIIGNEWYEPSLHRTVYCVEDLTTKLVNAPDQASATPGLSPQSHGHHSGGRIASCHRLSIESHSHLAQRPRSNLDGRPLPLSRILV